MPYGIRKSPNKNLYWVYNKETGKKFSKKPIPRERAEAQRRAIYASENGYRLNRSRSRSLRGGNRFKRSLMSLREKLRENLFIDDITKQRQLINKGINMKTYSLLPSEIKDSYKLTFIRPALITHFSLFSRGSNETVNGYYPMYFSKSLEMPDFLV